MHENVKKKTFIEKLSIFPWHFLRPSEKEQINWVWPNRSDLGYALYQIISYAKSIYIWPESRTVKGPRPIIKLVYTTLYILKKKLFSFFMKGQTSKHLYELHLSFRILWITPFIQYIEQHNIYIGGIRPLFVLSWFWHINIGTTQKSLWERGHPDLFKIRKGTRFGQNLEKNSIYHYT